MEIKTEFNLPYFQPNGMSMCQRVKSMYEKRSDKLGRIHCLKCVNKQPDCVYPYRTNRKPAE